MRKRNLKALVLLAVILSSVFLPVITIRGTDYSYTVYELGSSTDDASYIWGSGFSTSDYRIRLTSNTNDVTVGLHFPNVNIPQGSTIYSAKLELYMTQWASSSWYVWGQYYIDPIQYRLFCEDADNSATFSDLTDFLNRYVERTAEFDEEWVAQSSSWNQGNLGWSEMFDGIQNPIQEVIDRPGWTSGNGLTIFITMWSDPRNPILVKDGDTYQFITDFCAWELAGKPYTARLSIATITGIHQVPIDEEETTISSFSAYPWEGRSFYSNYTRSFWAWAVGSSGGLYYSSSISPERVWTDWTLIQSGVDSGELGYFDVYLEPNGRYVWIAWISTDAETMRELWVQKLELHADHTVTAVTDATMIEQGYLPSPHNTKYIYWSVSIATSKGGYPCVAFGTKDGNNWYRAFAVWTTTTDGTWAVSYYRNLYDEAAHWITYAVKVRVLPLDKSDYCWQVSVGSYTTSISSPQEKVTTYQFDGTDLSVTTDWTYTGIAYRDDIEGYETENLWAFATAGNWAYFVHAEEGAGTTTDLWLMRKHSSQTTWDEGHSNGSATQKITAFTDDQRNIKPQVVADRVGNVLCMWWEATTYGNSTLWGRRMFSNWTWADANPYIVYNLTYPVIIEDGDHSLIFQYSGDTLVYSAICESDAQLNPVMTGTFGDFSQRPRHFAQYSNGTYVLVYSESNKVYIRTSIDKIIWSKPYKITSGGFDGTSYTSTIFIDANDNMHIAWTGNDGSTTYAQIWYVNYTSAGWSTPVRVTDIDTTGPQTQAYLYIRPEASATNPDIQLVWQGKCALWPAADSVWYANRTSGVWSSETVVEYANSDMWREGIVVTETSDGEVFCIWKHQALYGYAHLSYRVLDRDVGWSGMSNPLGSGTGYQAQPQVIIDSDDNVWITYRRWYYPTPPEGRYDACLAVWTSGGGFSQVGYFDTWGCENDIDSTLVDDELIYCAYYHSQAGPTYYGRFNYYNRTSATFGAGWAFSNSYSPGEQMVWRQSDEISLEGLEIWRDAYWKANDVAIFPQVYGSGVTTSPFSIAYQLPATIYNYYGFIGLSGEERGLGYPWWSNCSYTFNCSGIGTDFYCHWDDTELDNYIFSWNGTGTWENDTAIAFVATPQEVYVEKTLPETVGTVIGFRFYANNTDGLWNATSIFTLTTCIAPPTVLDFDIQNSEGETLGVDTHKWIFVNEVYTFTVQATATKTVEFFFEDGSGEHVWMIYDVGNDTAYLYEGSAIADVFRWEATISESTITTVDVELMLNDDAYDAYNVTVSTRSKSGLLTSEWENYTSAFHIYSIGGLNFLEASGWAGVGEYGTGWNDTGASPWDIFAADTRTSIMMYPENFNYMSYPLPSGWQAGDTWIIEPQDETQLQAYMVSNGWKLYLPVSGVNHTVYPMNRISDCYPSATATSYHSYPFGMRLIDSPQDAGREFFAEYPFIRTISGNVIATIGFDLMVPADTGITGTVSIRNVGRWELYETGETGDTMFCIRVIEGNIYYLDNTLTWTQFFDYTPFTWHNVTIVLDMSARTTDVYIDTVLELDGVGCPGDVDEISVIGFYSNKIGAANYTDIFVDDLIGYTNFTGNYGGWARNTAIFKNLQSFQAVTGIGIEDPDGIEYVNEGYWEAGFDALFDGEVDWALDVIKVRINMTEGVSLDKNRWVKFNCTWMRGNNIIKYDQIYAFYEGYGEEGIDKDIATIYIDLWYNRLNASSVIEGRITSYYYGMIDTSLPFISNVLGRSWKEKSDDTISFCAMPLELNGTRATSRDIILTRVHLKVFRTDNYEFHYRFHTVNPYVFAVTGGRMEGIDGVDTRTTAYPKVPQGGLMGLLIGLWRFLVTVGTSAVSSLLTGIMSAAVNGVDWVFEFFFHQSGIFSGFLRVIMIFVGYIGTTLWQMSTWTYDIFTTYAGAVWGLITAGIGFIFSFLSAVRVPGGTLWTAILNMFYIINAWLTGISYTASWGNTYDFSAMSYFAAFGYTGGWALMALLMFFYVCTIPVRMGIALGSGGLSDMVNVVYEPVLIAWKLGKFVWQILTAPVRAIIWIVNAIKP